jgi:two-component system, NtrC family, nitrogen regulation sensor histidine kinase NtrY
MVNQASFSSRVKRIASVSYRRAKWLAVLEWACVALILFAGAATFVWVQQTLDQKLVVSPLVTVFVLLANLAPAILLIVLIGRRVAQKRAAASLVGANGQLHVRLVAMFSAVAALPVLILVILSSLIFQYGVDIWYSGRAKQMFENTTTLAESLYSAKQKRIMDETRAMAGDVANALQELPIESEDLAFGIADQLYKRELSEAAILTLNPDKTVSNLLLVNPYNRPKDNWVSNDVVEKVLKSRDTVFQDTGQRMETIMLLPGSDRLFLYTSRVSQQETIDQAQLAGSVMKDYTALVARSPRLQVMLNVTLYLISLLIIGIAVWLGLKVADRLVSPVGELVDAARKVAGGDLSVRVTPTRARDEMGVLSRAFNRMTSRLGEQNSELLSNNALLERRRALIEAVFSGVTAGIVAVDGQGRTRLLNNMASKTFRIDQEAAVGEPLSLIAPELSEMLDTGVKESIIDLIREGETRTLAVRLVRDEFGHVMTFDDITQRLVDQRRAAWSDVARRVAHEIKNPLTPIQLAAERLKRRFGPAISASDAPAFDKLVDTIVRQVGDLRRMVDEFSSFARMPKPVFEQESIVDIVRESVFLHEVANPHIRFTVEAPTPSPQIVCDRRQLVQAFSNLIKNGVEAIQQNDPPHKKDDLSVLIQETDQSVTIHVSDTGIGLPLERDRIVEPYMTTRPGGTGLGLPIVKKIVEEHRGTIQFDDRDGGGTVTTITLNLKALRELANEDWATGDRATGDRAAGDTDRIIGQSDSLPAKLTRVKS